MNAEQRGIATQLTPKALKLASVYGVDSGVALLALCTAILRYKPDGSYTLEAYAIAVTRQACRKEAQRERLRLSRELPAGDLARTAVARPDPARIETMLGKLPPVVREIARRKWVHRQTYRYIENDTGLSRRAILRHLNTARKLIRAGRCDD